MQFWQPAESFSSKLWYLIDQNTKVFLKYVFIVQYFLQIVPGQVKFKFDWAAEKLSAVVWRLFH